MISKLETKVFLASVIIAVNTSVFSAEKTPKLTPAESLMPMLGGLVLILVIIFGLAYVFKRFTNFNPASKNIKVLETQIIGAKEKLMIVRVKEQSFLIGVTGTNISQLGELNPQDKFGSEAAEQASRTNKQADFSTVLTNIVKNSIGLKGDDISDKNGPSKNAGNFS